MASPMEGEKRRGSDLRRQIDIEEPISKIES